MQNLMNNWAQNDPAGAGKFLAGLPEGKSRESAVQTYVSQLSYQSPEYAAPFVNLITDENQRFNSAQNLAHNYLRNDPEEQHAAAHRFAAHQTQFSYLTHRADLQWRGHDNSRLYVAQTGSDARPPQDFRFNLHAAVAVIAAQHDVKTNAVSADFLHVRHVDRAGSRARVNLRENVLDAPLRGIHILAPADDQPIFTSSVGTSSGAGARESVVMNHYESF
jgi:hypothetical protein